MSNNSNSFNKTYFEIYAALTLANIGYFSEPFNIDWIKDKPDIQVNNLGIEVVRDIPSYLGELENLWNKTQGLTKKQKEEKLKIIDKKEKSKEYFSDDKMSMSLPVHDEKLIVQAIRKKEGKFNLYDQRFEIGLFIFSDVFLLDQIDRDKLIKIFTTEKSSYSSIFTKYHNKLFEWTDEELREHNLTGAELAQIKIQSQALNKKYFNSSGIRKEQSL